MKIAQARRGKEKKSGRGYHELIDLGIVEIDQLTYLIGDLQKPAWILSIAVSASARVEERLAIPTHQSSSRPIRRRDCHVADRA